MTAAMYDINTADMRRKVYNNIGSEYFSCQVLSTHKTMRDN